MHDIKPVSSTSVALSTVAPPASATPLTVAVAITTVETWSDLTAKHRRDLVSALHTIARMAGLQPDATVLTPQILRQAIPVREGAVFGVKTGTMRNVFSRLRFVLRRLDVIDRVNDTPSLAWSALLDLLDQRARAGLIAFARFCSQRQIAPEAVDGQTLAAFETHLAERTLKPRTKKFVGELRGNWNRACQNIAGWPGNPIAKVRDPGDFHLPIGAFPASFQADLDAFGKRLGGSPLDDRYDETVDPDLDADDQAPLPPRKPARAITVALRQSHCRWAASALVATGVPIAEVTSLASLVKPLGHAHRTLRFLRDRSRQKAPSTGHHVAEILLMIAQHHVGLPEKDIERIKRWRDPLILKYSGMTEKNERCVRLMRHPVRRENLKQLPAALMAAAHDLLAESPADAAVLALRATAIGLLSRLPIRLKNLLDLRINQHLQRDDPRQGRITFLAVQPDETKNNRAILMPVSPQTADLLEEWIKYFRPLVAAPGCLRLFPGHGTGDQPMTHQGMREAIKTTVLHHVGVALTPQQFRHVAADIFLEAYPGHYAEVQRLLGHKSLATTMRAYCSRDQPAAVRRYDELLDSIQTDRKPAKQRSARSRTFSKASKR